MARSYFIIWCLLAAPCVSLGQWQPLNGPEGGNITDIEIDAATGDVYVLASNELLYVSTDDGANWTQLSASAAINPTDFLIDGTVMYAINFSSFYKSEDKGLSWQRTTNTVPFTGANQVIKHPTLNSLIAYGSGGVFVSNNEGLAWKQVHSSNTTSVTVTANGDLYIADNQGILRHPTPVDNPDPWNAQGFQMVYGLVSGNIKLAAAGNVVYAATKNDVLKSVDSGTSWPSVKTSTITESNINNPVWATTANGVYLFTLENVYYSGDGGTNWEKKVQPASVFARSMVRVVRFASNSVAYSGHATDGLLKTTNAGTSWSRSGKGIHFFPGRDIVVAASGRIICANSDGSWFSDDSGQSWTFKKLMTGSSSGLLKLPTDTLLVFGTTVMKYSADNGNTWHDNATNHILNDVTFNTAFASDTYFGTGSNRISRSKNANNWVNLTIAGMPASYVGQSIAQDDAGRLYVYVLNATEGKYQIYRIDGISESGTTGTATLLNVPLADTDVAANFLQNKLFISAGKLYVSTANNIHITADQGLEWTTVSFRKYSLFPIRKGSTVGIGAGAAGMLYVTQDDGMSWVGTSMPSNSVVTYIQNVTEDSNGDYLAATFNGAVLKFTDDLVVPQASLPPYIDFDWQPTQGPYGNFIQKVVTDQSGNRHITVGGGVYTTNSNFEPWTLTATPTSFVDLEVSGNKLLGLSSNALYSSSTGGATWDLLNSENIQSRRLLRRCPNGDLVFATTVSRSIYVSTDGGVTFGSPKYTAPAGYTIGDIIVTSSNAIIAYLIFASPFEAIISTDRGNTWNPLPLYGSTGRLSADADGNVYYNATPISKTLDHGETWIPIDGDLSHSFITSPVQVSSSGDLYVTAALDSVYSDNALFKSTDGGLSWIKKARLPSGQFFVYQITWSGERMILATSRGVLVSDDDGTTLTTKNTNILPSTYTDLELRRPTGLIASTPYAPGSISTDHQTWVSPDSPVNIMFRIPDGTLMGHSTTHLYSSADEGDTWTMLSAFPAYFSLVTTRNGTTFYAYSGDQLFVATNPSSWSKVVVTGLPQSFFYTDMALDASGRLYVVIRNNTTLLTECFRISFGSATRLDAFENPTSLLSRDDKIYVYETTGLISTTSDGESWTTQAAPAGTDFMITDNGYYFIPISGGALWLSRDDGRSWQNVGLTNQSTSTRFLHVVIDGFTGYAYATMTNSVVRKSGNIVILPETDPPKTTALQPASGAVSVPRETSLTITFDEPVKPAAGKKVRVFNAENTLTPVEIIDVSAGTQNGTSLIFTPTALEYTKTYFITVDNGAVKDIFGNNYAGIADENTWRFTVENTPDTEKPVISYTHTSAFTKGAANSLTVTVTDNGGSGVDPAAVKLFYRGITSSDPAVSTSMTKGSGDLFTATVSDSWMDELGIEFRFEAKDLRGNTAVLPNDGTYFKTYIAFPTAQNPALPSALLASGGQVENYRIFSIPHKLADPRISTVFNELSGQSVRTDYRILHFNATSKQYTEHPSLSTISQGLGYWVNIKTPPAIVIEQAATPENSKEKLATLLLTPGWNQIGNPYPFPVSWNAVRTASGDPNIGVLKTFNGSGWIEDDVMGQFEGGFVFVNGSSNIDVAVPFSAKASSGRTRDTRPDFSDGWLLPLTVEDSKFKVPGGIGMHPDAHESFDLYDDALPPKVFDMPEIAFAHHEHLLKKFTRDVVPMRNTYVWNFTAHAGNSNTHLQWNPADARATGGHVYLLDESTQKLVDMRVEREHLVQKKQSSTFKIYYGFPPEEIAPTRITLGTPHPNPVAGNCYVDFTLPERLSGPYHVCLDVVDPLGRAVATLRRGMLDAGFYTCEWKPDAESLLSTVYLCRLTVSAGNNPVMLTERLIIKR